MLVCVYQVCFLRALCEHPRFTSGNLSTEFIDDEYSEGFQGIKVGAPITYLGFSFFVFMNCTCELHMRTAHACASESWKQEPTHRQHRGNTIQQLPIPTQPPLHPPSLCPMFNVGCTVVLCLDTGLHCLNYASHVCCSTMA